MSSPERPLRVVHATTWMDPIVGGPPRVIVGLSAGLQRRGHEIRLISGDWPDNAAVDALFAARMDPPPHRTCCRPKFVYPVVTRDRIARALDGADVVHIHSIWPLNSLVVSQVARQMGIPYVLTLHCNLHEAAVRQKVPKKFVGRHLLGFGKMIREAAAIHALNAEERDGAQWPLPPRVRVIPNGVFPEEFAAPPPAGAFRATLPALGDAPYVLFLSRLHWSKGLDLLGDAFAAVAATRPDLHLVVVGEDSGGQALLEERAARHGYSSRVHYTGAIDGPRKDAAFTDSAAFCLPSRHEGFSIALIEAMAWACPVVATEACHFPQITEVGAGVETPVTAAGIAEGLLCVVNHPERAELGTRGRALILERYTWPAIADQMAALYREVMG